VIEGKPRPEATAAGLVLSLLAVKDLPVQFYPQNRRKRERGQTFSFRTLAETPHELTRRGS